MIYFNGKSRKRCFHVASPHRSMYFSSTLMCIPNGFIITTLWSLQCLVILLCESRDRIWFDLWKWILNCGRTWTGNICRCVWTKFILPSKCFPICADCWVAARAIDSLLMLFIALLGNVLTRLTGEVNRFTIYFLNAAALVSFLWSILYIFLWHKMIYRYRPIAYRLFSWLIKYGGTRRWSETLVRVSIFFGISPLFFFIYARVMMIDQQQKQRAHNTSSTISTTISLYIRFNAANATAAAKSDQLIASSYTQTRNIKSNSFSFLCAA